MHLVWNAAALALPLLLALYFLSGRSIGHRFLLVLGMFVYLVLPFFAYATGIYEGGPGQRLWENAFESLYQQSALVLGVVLLLVVAFIAADALPSPRSNIAFDRPLAPALLGIVFGCLAAIWAAYLFQARELLFSGYLLDYRPDLMGPLSNVNLATLLVLLNLWQWRQSRLLLWAFVALLAFNSAALLSMGARLYVAAPVVGLAVFFFNSPMGRRPALRLAGLALACVAILLLGLVGLLRAELETDLRSVGQLLLAEPLLTSISLGTLVDCRLVDWINLPANYLSSIVNFAPSALLPEKAQLLVELDPTGNCLASPFGATHIGTALLVNFGLVGAVIVVMLFSYLMKTLGRHGGWWLYYYLCSLLPFTLFRDGFPIFNKAFFGTGLLFAVALVALSPRSGRVGSVPSVAPPGLARPAH